MGALYAELIFDPKGRLFTTLNLSAKITQSEEMNHVTSRFIVNERVVAVVVGNHLRRLPLILALLVPHPPVVAGDLEEEERELVENGRDE